MSPPRSLAGVPTAETPCLPPSSRPGDGLKTSGSVVSRHSPKLPGANVLANATSAFWRRSPSLRRALLGRLPPATRQLISLRRAWPRQSPIHGQSRSDALPQLHLRAHNRLVGGFSPGWAPAEAVGSWSDPEACVYPGFHRLPGLEGIGGSRSHSSCQLLTAATTTGGWPNWWPVIFNIILPTSI